MTYPLLVVDAHAISFPQIGTEHKAEQFSHEQIWQKT